MRKRNVQILFRMTEEEAEYLYDLVRKSGYSKKPCSVRWSKDIGSARSLTLSFIKSCGSCPLSETVFNQLAAKANALDYIDTPMLQEEAARWRQFQTDVRKAICSRSGDRDNGGVRDMGCAWQARPPHRLCREPGKDP